MQDLYLASCAVCSSSPVSHPYNMLPLPSTCVCPLWGDDDALCGAILVKGSTAEEVGHCVSFADCVLSMYPHLLVVVFARSITVHHKSLFGVSVVL